MIWRIRTTVKWLIAGLNGGSTIRGVKISSAITLIFLDEIFANSQKQFM